MPIRIMAGVTFREAARKKILWMALAGGCAFLILFAIALHFQQEGMAERHAPAFLRKQVLNNALMLGLYAIDLLAVVLTVMTSVDTLSGEIESGTIQAIATKPIRRWQLMAGKWIGFAAMLAVYLLLMTGGLNVIAYILSGAVVRHFAQGFSLICMESALLLSLTFFFGASFSTLTNGVLVLGLHGLAFLGGWIEQAGALTHTPKAVAVGVLASVLMPSESLWRRAAFEMQSPLVSALNVSPFTGMSVPSGAMITYAALYTSAFLLLAMWRLERRDL
jgi:ABC-2 type transport system permease protein